MSSVFGVASLAHAFGKRYDLPVPLYLFVMGGAAVVFVSFLFVVKRSVNPDHGTAIVPDPAAPQRSAPIRRTLALLLTALLIYVGIAGSQGVAENILPTMFWLLAWVVVPISCGIVGDWTRPLNPFAALARFADRPGIRRGLSGASAPLTWSEQLGWWPASVLFFVVACGELIFNSTATLPAVTAYGLLAYGVMSALAGFTFGADAWIARGELFSVLFNTWGRLGWARFGAMGVRGFGGGLRAGIRPSVSRITFVLLLLVSVSFDGLLSTDAWKTVRFHLPFGIESGSGAYLTTTVLAFAALVAVAWLVFGGFAAAVRRVGGMAGSQLDVLCGLLPSLLPIAFGYLLAHNAEYIAISGQLLVPLLGNPAGFSGVSLLPAPFNDSYEVNPNLLPSGIVWYSQVVLIIAVHVIAVVLAHRYLGRTVASVKRARKSEWPWIVAMVGYTMTSLWLLAQPLVNESTAAAAMHWTGGMVASLVT